MKKLLVIGSANMDVLLEVEHVPKTGESCLCKKIIYGTGGKGANQAIAASRLGCETSFYGIVGNDEYGKKIIENLNDNNVDIQNVKISNVNTGTAFVLLEENGENRIVVSMGANNEFTNKDVKLIQNIIDDYEIILLQLEIPIHIVELIIKLANEKNKIIIVDAGPARKCNLSIFNNVTYLSPNETEAKELTGINIRTLQDANKAASIFMDYGVKGVIFKRGAQGSIYVDRNICKEIPSKKVKVIDTTAAGDAFTAAVAVKLLDEFDIITAIEYAVKVGALTVTKKGAQSSIPYDMEVENYKWDKE